MKILFIFHNTDLAGGATLSGLTLIRGLKKLGHSVHAVCPSECELVDILRKEHFETIITNYYIACPTRPHTVKSIIAYFPRLIRNIVTNRKAATLLTKAASEIGIDIIHSNSSVINIGYKVSKSTGIPHVMHFREYGLKDTNCYTPHIPRILRYPLQFNIAVSHGIADYRGMDLNSNSRIIYNGVFPKDICRMNSKPDNYLLYVGQLHKAKGILDLLDAYAALPASMRKLHPLLVAGKSNTPEFQQLLSTRINKLDIKDNVRLLGYRKDASDLMYNASAMIVPSHNEAFGRIIPEAMANGCIVIGNNNAGIKEQFDNGVEATGEEIGIRYSGVENLTFVLTKFLSTPDSPKIRLMRMRALEVVKELYTNENSVRAVDKFYRGILPISSES